MPVFYGVCTTLESQYDIRRIQEHIIPSNHSSLNRNGNSSASSTSNKDVQKALSSVEEVFVPIYTNSQFWLSYLIVPNLLLPPHPTSSQEIVSSDDIKYVYFKLIFPNSSKTAKNKCTHGGNNDDKRVISWGVGAKDGWKGKTMFGLFKDRKGLNGRLHVDKRGFWFAEDGEREGMFEVQVFRARGRRRDNRVFPEMQARKREGNEVERVCCSNDSFVSSVELTHYRLVVTGPLKGYHPQRYYQYALIDAVDEPYVTFRYRLRSMGNMSDNH